MFQGIKQEYIFCIAQPYPMRAEFCQTAQLNIEQLLLPNLFIDIDLDIENDIPR